MKSSWKIHSHKIFTQFCYFYHWVSSHNIIRLVCASWRIRSYQNTSRGGGKKILINNLFKLGVQVLLAWLTDNHECMNGTVSEPCKLLAGSFPAWVIHVGASTFVLQFSIQKKKFCYKTNLFIVSYPSLFINSII